MFRPELERSRNARYSPHDRGVLHCPHQSVGLPSSLKSVKISLESKYQFAERNKLNEEEVGYRLGGGFETMWDKFSMHGAGLVGMCRLDG